MRCTLPQCDCVGVCKASTPAMPSVRAAAAFHGMICPYCACKMDRNDPLRKPTYDHVEPRALAGSNAVTNLLGACWTCNNDKGAMTLEQFFQFLVDADDDRAMHVARVIRNRNPAGAGLDQGRVKSILRILASEAQARAKEIGLEVAVCVVAINEDYASSFVSPFEAEPLQSLGVSNQLDAQAKMIGTKAMSRLQANGEAAE